MLLLLLGCSGPSAQADAPGLAVQAEVFHTFVVGPWVVRGDGDPIEVERRAEHTVRWAHELLVAEYFPVLPAEPVDVWLYKDARSYEEHVLATFGEAPDTPYGFANERGLFMDISTGGGTLVHEMVHPLLGANFPDCPPWFNEGLASLYEAVGEEDGRLHGMLNWRLPGLQEHIRSGELPSFEHLMSRSSHQFYEQDPGSNYSQSRYLLYYLQEQGLLQAYYRTFTANVATDPTGLDSLKQVLRRQDIEAFQAEWEIWVLDLKS